MGEIEPLEPTLWFAAVWKLDQRSKRAAMHELESLLRHSYHPLQLTPRQFRKALQPALPEVAFEQLLEVGDLEAAAKGLLGAPATFSVSQPSAGLFEACVATESGPLLAQAAEPATALLRAWIKSVMAMKVRTTTPRSENLRPAPRKGRSAPHLRLIEQ